MGMPCKMNSVPTGSPFSVSISVVVFFNKHTESLFIQSAMSKLRGTANMSVG